ncbi:MAG: hypothetical protein KDH96_07440 [Candidatus Riesia sp.]|nr:hypothetical protein [Candidatus Riesia sp.]
MEASNLPHLLGITGYARSGKDTVADILVEKFSYTKVGFTDELKECLVILNPIVKVESAGPVHYQDLLLRHGDLEAIKREDPVAMQEVRRLLQTLGTEVMRNKLGSNVHIDMTFNKIERSPISKNVIKDVRYKNEAKALRERGGKVIRVTRPGVSAPPNSHSSETELDHIKVDAVINNDGTMKDLEASILRVISSFD